MAIPKLRSESATPILNAYRRRISAALGRPNGHPKSVAIMRREWALLCRHTARVGLDSGEYGWTDAELAQYELLAVDAENLARHMGGPGPWDPQRD